MTHDRNKTAASIVAATTALLVGCGTDSRIEERPAAKATQQGLHVTVGPTTGVTDVQFVVTSVDCATGAPIAKVVDATKPLDDLSVPESIPELGDHPLDVGSKHAFADQFVLLEAGCYDVLTQPFDAGAPACHPAQRKGVVVAPGATTEVFLVNQCDGTTPGALDVIAALNHPPQLTDVSFAKSKFVRSCGDQIVCASAIDPERDPLRFVWQPTGGPAVAGPFDVTSTTNADGSITQCARFIPTGTGKVTLDVSVYDLLHNNAGMSTPETFEQWESEQGYPNASHTTLGFFFYAESPATPPVAEVCADGVDNDCDGLVDGADSDCAPIPDGGCAAPTVPICDEAVDLVVLEDLTGSFFDDLAKVGSFSSTLASDLLAANPGTRFGVASFQDKPLGGFGSPADHVYRLELPLTGNVGSFVGAIAGLHASGGGDGPEAQLEALNLLAKDAAAGFGSSTPRFVVLATDAPPHVAPQCVAAGLCSGPNNDDAVADPSEDYPSIAQLEATLNAQGITPIFAVAGGNESFYQPIVDDLHRGRVVKLASDSANLESAIFAGLPCHCGTR